MRVARRLNSNLLKANAWHSRSDAMSSVAVLIGLIAAQQGLAISGVDSSGGKILLEAQLAVNPCISVSEGHQLGESVSRSLIARFSDVGDVIVHIDPQPELESAQAAAHPQELPDRSEVIGQIKARWRDLLADDDFERLDLHYLEHGIEIDLVVKPDKIPTSLISGLEQAVQSFDYIAKLRIYRKLSESSNVRRLS